MRLGSIKDVLLAGWSIGGVLLTLIVPLRKIVDIALEPIRQGEFGASELIAYVGSIIFLGFFEGYRGFQLAFSPRTVARTAALIEDPKPLRVVLAPAFAMGLFGATKKRLAVSWGVVIGVTLLVILVSRLDQPWRGAVDAGVVVGLGWGAASIVWFTIAAARGRPLPVGPDLPEQG